MPPLYVVEQGARSESCSCPEGYYDTTSRALNSQKEYRLPAAHQTKNAEMIAIPAP
mgnify:CR=1 FL=1